MLAIEVTKESLNTLVLKFYAKVLKDDLIGPIFVDVLGENLKEGNWPAHIELITNFWASLALGEKNYNSSPFAPHIKLKERLSVSAFERWLELFNETLNTIFHPQIAEQFLAKSKTIAGNFMRNLQIT